MIETLAMILVVVAVAYAAFWIIDQMDLPEPLDMIIKIVVGLSALISVLQPLL